MRNGASVKTSMIGMESFISCFEKALISGDDILYVGMSGGISGSASSAAVAVNRLKGKYPKADIVAIDTYAASLGEGLLVLKAAEMLEDGKTLEEVSSCILRERDRMCQYFTVDDLAYLKRGGRISSSVALVGSILHIKPIFKGDETGHIVMCGKTRGSKRALDALAEKYGQLVVDRNSTIGIAHADNEKGGEYLLNRLREKGFAGKCRNVIYEPVTGSHVGPGTIALFFPGIKK